MAHNSDSDPSIPARPPQRVIYTGRNAKKRQAAADAAIAAGLDPDTVLDSGAGGSGENDRSDPDAGAGLRDTQAMQDQSEDQSFREITEMLSNEGLAGGTCRIDRRGPLDTGFAYIGKMSVNAFDIETIKKIYGGGDYVCEFFRSNGQKAGKRKFSIDPRFKGAIDIGVHGVQTPAGQGDNVAMIRVLAESMRPDPNASKAHEAMARSQSETMQMFMAMMEKSSQQNMAMMSAMMTAMGQAFAGMGAKNVTPSDGLKMTDVVSMFTLLKGSGGNDGGTDILKLVSAMKGIQEMTQIGSASTKEADDEPKTMIDKILGALPHVATTVNALRGGNNTVQPAAGAPVRRQLPPNRGAVGAPAPAAPAAPTPAPTQPDRLAAGLNIIVTAARRKADVGLYSDLILDTVPEAEIGDLTEILTADDWFAQLFGSLPDAPSLQPWLTELRNNILEAVMPADEVETDPNLPPTNGADSTGSVPKTDSGDSAGVRPADSADGAS